jgi:hypothetical protein
MVFAMAPSKFVSGDGCGDHLGRGLKCRTQFWKGTTQGSFQQSLVEIGSVVSEEIFLNFISPFFYF